MNRKTNATVGVATTPKPELVNVGKVGGTDVLVPRMDARAKAVAQALAQYKDLIITTEDEKVWISENYLRPLVAQRNEAKRELAKITDPLVESRRQALAAKNAAENLFAPFFAGTEAAERLLKDKIVQFEVATERKRLQEEAESRRKAEEEQARIEAEAQRVADDAARKFEEENRQAAELELAGKKDEAEHQRAQAERDLEESAEKVEHLQEDAEQTMTQAVVPSSSVKLKGQALTGKWIAEVVDVKEVLAGIVAGTTPFEEAVRAKVEGRLVEITKANRADITSIEISTTWFNEKARKEGENFNYRGMKARYVNDLRVTA